VDVPLISCIVPVYNGEQYLREALESVFSQSCRPREIIVVDDGSTDQTGKIIAGYGDKVCHLAQPNSGPASARNLGLRRAGGEFIAFLDVDDLWHSDKLKLQLNRFKARPELDICVSHIKNFWISELKEEEIEFRGHRLSKPLPGYVLQTMLARKRIFGSIGTFDESFPLGSDTEWFLRAAEQGALMDMLPDVLVYRRYHHSNITRLDDCASKDALLKAVKSSLDRRRSADGSKPKTLGFPKSDWSKEDK
jgi:glycosyltransferase involved in cell wall biosynthesis